MYPFPVICVNHKTFQIDLNSKTIHFGTKRVLKMNLNESQVTLSKPR